MLVCKVRLLKALKSYKKAIVRLFTFRTFLVKFLPVCLFLALAKRLLKGLKTFSSLVSPFYSIEKRNNKGFEAFLLKEANGKYFQKALEASHHIIACFQEWTMSDMVKYRAALWSFFNSLPLYFTMSDIVHSNAPSFRVTMQGVSHETSRQWRKYFNCHCRADSLHCIYEL